MSVNRDITNVLSIFRKISVLARAVICSLYDDEAKALIDGICVCTLAQKVNSPTQFSLKVKQMQKLSYVVKRGRSVGTVLTPHLHVDNHFVVSLTRYERDYQRVKEEQDLVEWVRKGYSVRMSNQSVKSHRSPSLISPNSIDIRET